MSKWLKFLIAAILLLLPTYLIRFQILSVPTTFLEIYIYLIFILFLIEKIKNREKVLSVKFILPAMLLIIAVISSYFAGERDVALGQTKAVFFDGLLALIMFYSLRDDEDFQKKSILFYIISGVFVSIWGILQRINIVGLLSHQRFDQTVADQINQGRILGPFESPNYLAMFLAPLVVILVISYFGNSNFKSKKMFWPLLVIFGLTLVLTQSASAFIAVFLTLVFYFLFTSKSRMKWLYVGSALVIIIAGVWGLAKYSSKSGSVASRKEIYLASIDIGKSHQFFGIGINNFSKIFGAYNFPSYFSKYGVVDRLNYEAMHPHNIFLALWLYMGWPGLIVFVLLVILALRKENYQKNPVFYFALLCILINGLTDTTVFKNDLSLIFWWVIAFLI